MMKKYIIIFILINYTHIAYSQNPANGSDLSNWVKDNEKTTVVSPNAASLGIYGSIPVGHHTGVPQIDIPLYEINLDGKSIPINLSYHAAGIKVRQEASWVGLGWSLNIGGSIIREVKGLDDFDNSKGYYYMSDSFFDNQPSDSRFTITNLKPNSLTEYYVNKTKDPEPDILTCNFAGYAGQFFVDKVGKGANTLSLATGQLMNNDKYLDIKFNLSKTWIITDGDGYKYYFGTYEETITKNASSSRLEAKIESLSYGNRELNPEVKTAWMLDSIVSPNNNKVYFTYEYENITTIPTVYEDAAFLYNYSQASNGASGVMKLKPKDKRYLYNISDIKQVRLKEINFDAGKIILKSSKRLDLKGDAHKLDAIEIRDSQQKTVKFYGFKYSYSGNTSSPNTCRLILNSLYENSVEKAYTFHYNSRELPPKTSLQVDVWGYYSTENGPLMGSSETKFFETVPTYFVPYTATGKNIILQGNDYIPSLKDMKALVLEKIQYPTGGSTVFEYEGHKVSTIPIPDDPFKEFDYSVFTNVDGNVSLVNPESNAGGDSGQQIGNAFWLENETFLEITSILFRRGVANGSSSCRLELQRYNEITNKWDFINSQFIGGLFWKNETEMEYLLKNKLEKGKYRFELIPQNPLREYHYFLHTKIRALAKWKYVDLPDGIAGLRIKKMIDKSDKINEQKEFKYEKDGVSTGVLYVTPTFISDEYRHSFISNDLHIGVKESGQYLVGRSYSSSRLSRSSQPVGYSYVEEITGVGKTVYKYPNKKDIQMHYLYPLPGFPNYSDPSNGLLASKEVYDSKDKLIQKTFYTYDWLEYDGVLGMQCYINRNISNSNDVYVTHGEFYSLPSYRFFIKEEQTTSYFPSTLSEVTETKKYSYNPVNHLVNNVEIKDSKNNKREDKLLYPTDYTDAISEKMKKKSMINYPIEKIILVDGKETLRLKNIYFQDKSLSTDLIKPNHVLYSTSGIKDLKKEISYDLYDNRGNILQKTNNQNVSTSYLWSYSGQHPIAELQNATYAQITAIITESNLKTISEKALPSDADIQMINNLRNNVNLKGAMITTYTYKPLVGMTSMTDPSGITTYYDYDNFGRLKETYIIENGIKKIIQAHDYHYQTP